MELKDEDRCWYCDQAGTDHRHGSGRSCGDCCGMHGALSNDKDTYAWIKECLTAKNARIADAQAALAEAQKEREAADAYAQCVLKARDEEIERLKIEISEREETQTILIRTGARLGAELAAAIARAERNWKQCGKYAAPFIPREGSYFACVLEEGHEGDCLPGGTCVRHGFHTGVHCPHWPTCIKTAALSSPGTAAGEKEEKLKLAAPINSLQTFWDSHAAWSRATFGQDHERGPIGPLKHLEKEAMEAYTETDPQKMLVEIADCLLLTLDAARRAGMTLEMLIDVAWNKLAANRQRTWAVSRPNEAVEHIRGGASE